MKQLFISLGLVSLILCGSCEKEEPLSPEAAAMKLLILNDINAVEDLMFLKVYNPELESIFQGWNSDEEDGHTFIEIELGDRSLFATHRLFDEEMEEWGETSIDLPYEDIDDYLVQNNKLVDGLSGEILRVGNNLVVYMKEHEQSSK
jgi:hypothetical protein